MPIRFIMAGLDLFKRSQLAIFDKAISLVDLFDTAVSDSVQVIYPHQVHRREHSVGAWKLFTIFLEGCFKQILLIFLFTVVLLCLSVLVLRHRRRYPLYTPSKPSDDSQSPSNSTGKTYPLPVKPANVLGENSPSVGERQEELKVQATEESQREEVNVPELTRGVVVTNAKESRVAQRKTEPNLRKSQVVSPSVKKLDKPKRVTKPNDSKGRVFSRKKSVEKQSTITKAISNILSKKLVSPGRKLRRHPERTNSSMARRVPRMVVNKDKVIQDKSSAKNRAQVFILLSGLDEDNLSKKKQTVTSRKRSKSPRKCSPRKILTTSPPRRLGSQTRKNNAASPRQRNASRGRQESRFQTRQNSSRLDERQRQIANIPYLHTTSGRRASSSKPGSRNNRQPEQGRNKTVGVYLSPKSRMAKAGRETKGKSPKSKGGSVSPSKRCKTCKKIRQNPELALPTELLPIRKRTKDNIGSLFCFSPDAVLPAPFQNARLKSNIHDILQTATKSSNFSCGEDTNMNKAVLKLELQSDMANNHALDTTRFAIGENVLLSSNKPNNDAGGPQQNTRKFSDCLSCRIHHNTHPVKINQTHIGDTKRANTGIYQIHDHQNESGRYDKCGHISRLSRHLQAKQCNHHNTYSTRSQMPGDRTRVADDTNVQAACQDLSSGLHLKNFNGWNTRFYETNSSHPNNQTYGLFGTNYPTTLQMTRDQNVLSWNKLPNRHRTLSVERWNKHRKQKKDLFRESRRKCRYKKPPCKFSHSFSFPPKLLDEHLGDNGGGTSLCKNNAIDLAGEEKSQTELDYKPYDLDETDPPTRRCDKIKSHKWRHRHEPYKFASTKNNSTRAQSPEDLSNTTLTLNPPPPRNMETHRENGGQPHYRKPKVTDLAELARFTASTDTSKDVSSSDADRYTFSVQSGSSCQNKNNCSPSRLAKPFIRPVSEIPADTTIETHAGHVTGCVRVDDPSPPCGGHKDPLSPLFGPQESGEDSKRATTNDDNTYTIGSYMTGPFAQGTSIGPTGEGQTRELYSPPQKPRLEDKRHDTYPILTPHSDTKIGSLRQENTTMLYSINRPRNKAYRQQRLFKYPVKARKNVSRTVTRLAPKQSTSTNEGPTGHSVSLGVQTSHTSLRHIAVQTSPPQERSPTSQRHQNDTPAPHPRDRSVKDNNAQTEQSHEMHNKATSPTHIHSDTSSKANRQSGMSKKRILSRDDAMPESMKNVSCVVEDCQSAKQYNDDTSDRFEDRDDPSHFIVSDGMEDENNDTTIKTDEEMKPYTQPIRRQSLPILSLSSSAGDVKSDVLISTSRESSPSNSLLDSHSKDWLTRPKWENANVDEVNRRVERALRLRQELQQYKSGKTPVSPQKMFKPSLFSQGRPDMTEAASTSKIGNDPKDAVSSPMIKNPESKLKSLFTRKIDVTENNKNLVRHDSLTNIGVSSVRRVESDTTDTLVKTFPFIARPTASPDSGKTPSRVVRKEAVKHGDSTTETDETSSETPERYQSFPEDTARAVPINSNSSFLHPSSTMSLSRNTNDDSRVEESEGNVPRHIHHHRAPATKNSPPIKISKMENVIQTEYPKLVGELVQALPHVPLASFVEWFIETSNPGQFVSSDESSSTAADAKDAVAKETISSNSALESTDNDRSVIYVQDRPDENTPDKNQQQNASNSSKPLARSDMINAARTHNPTPFRNSGRLTVESQSTLDKLSTAEEESECNVASIRRILLTRKTSGNENSDDPVSQADSRRRIITLRQASSASTFEEDIP